jgi:hypothetical protein
MTDLRTAAEQALAALRVAQDHWHTYHGGLQSGEINKAITAIKAALEQPDQYEQELRDSLRRLVKYCNELEALLFQMKPRREWRGLTEEEIRDGREQLPTEDLCNWSFRKGVEFAEAALKEKNA